MVALQRLARYWPHSCEQHHTVVVSAVILDWTVPVAKFYSKPCRLLKIESKKHPVPVPALPPVVPSITRFWEDPVNWVGHALPACPALCNHPRPAPGQADALLYRASNYISISDNRTVHRCSLPSLLRLVCLGG